MRDVKTQAEREVEEAEALLREPTTWLRRQIKEDTKRQTKDITPESEVAVFAVVTNPGTQVRGTVQVAKYSVSDLYAFSEAPVIEFNNSVCEVLDKLEQMRKIPDADLEFEVQAGYMWHLVANLQRYLGTSSAHDEVLASFQQICFLERTQQFDSKKLRVLVNALDVLRDNVFLSEPALDNFAEILQGGGFDLNAPMAFLKDPP